MSKDFEKEYRELAQTETPDLWDRIEAGLSEKPIPEVSTQPGKKKQSVLMIFKKYQAVAAALLCLVIAVPALLLMKQQGMKSEEPTEAVYEAPAEMVEYAASDRNTEITTEETVSEEAIEETAYEATEATMAGGADTAPAEAAEEIAEAEAASAEATEEAAETEAAVLTEDTAERDVAEELKEFKQSSAAKEQAHQILEHVEIKITGSKELVETEKSNELELIYIGEVVAYDGDELKVGDEITIFVPAYFSVGFIKDTCYEMDLTYRDQANDSYMVESIYY